MKYNFDEIIDRRETGSVRWDMARKKYEEPDLIALTTADMDFKAAKPVCDAIRDAAEFGIFGYTQPKDSYYEAVQQRLQEKWNWKVQRDWITYSAGIVGAIAFCVQGMTEPGDAIAIMTPVYHPFAHIIEDNGRRPVHTCLIQKEGAQPEIDFADLEKVIAENQVKMLIFCNPHNPIGRVWTKEEIDHICRLCVKYGVILISDEIHSDFVFSGYKFCSAGPSMEETGGLNQLVVCTAASKSFNIAGLQCSGIIIPDEGLRGKYRRMLMNQHFMEMNLIGPLATEAGYRYGAEWLEQGCAYLEETRGFIVEYLNIFRRSYL